MSDDTIRRVQDSLDRDRRFRAMVISVAHEAYGKHYFDGESDECARDAITLAAALMLQRIYDEDAELHYLRAAVERLTSDRLSFAIAQPQVQAVFHSCGILIPSEPHTRPRDLETGGD